MMYLALALALLPAWEITAYTWTGHRTASGVWPEIGHVACPPRIELGAKVWIEGEGVYLCADRGGAIKGNRLDLFVADSATALKWGRKHRRVVVR